MKEHSNIVRALLAGILVAGLASCGDSDLVDIHERDLDDAIAALNEPSSAPANPATTPDAGAEGEAEPGSENEQNGEQDPGTDNPLSIDLSQYELVFNDEFNADSLDASKWNTSLPWGPDFFIYNQLQYYVDTQGSSDFGYNPFSLDGETLTISAIETPESLRAAASEQAWLSGVLTTADHFDLTYGYIETRISVEEGRGLWPAFWMLGSALDGLRPELFIMEHDGSKRDSFFHNYNYQDSSGDLLSPGQQEVIREGLSSGFHTVGVRWSESEMLFYIDGTPSYRIIGENVPRENMYLILNLAIGGIWPGAPDATTPRPASISIDYVRAYQLAN